MKIIPEKLAKYKTYVKKNSKDGYSKYVVDWTECLGDFLDAGKTPKEAEKLAGKKFDEGTGFQMGCVAQAIAYFHPQGQEFRVWWNGQYNIGPEKKGVVNPAILTMK